ncbi:hypothetical protein COOONC_21325 [Cooperia oncophora]
MESGAQYGRANAKIMLITGVGDSLEAGKTDLTRSLTHMCSSGYTQNYSNYSITNYTRTTFSQGSQEKMRTNMRILLTLCNVDEPRHTLRELNLLCYRMDWTIVLCYSVSHFIIGFISLALLSKLSISFRRNVS